MHRLGQAPLDTSDLFGVEAELKNVRGLSVARELGVERLVAADRPANDEVGQPAPAVVGERGLVDDACALTDGVFGGAGGDVPADFPRLSDKDDVIAERGEIRSLMSSPLRRMSRRAGCAGRVSVARRAQPRLERRQVRTGDEGREIRRRQDELAVDRSHVRMCPP